MMQRYKLVEYESAPPDIRVLYDDYLHSTGSTQIPVWIKSLGHSPDLLQAYWFRTKGSLLSGSLPMVLKELVIFTVSVENGSRYCAACHAHAVLQLDRTLTFDDLLSMTDPETMMALPMTYRRAVWFAARMARSANALADSDFERLAQGGFNDEEISELLGIIDLAVMLNTYTSAARLPLDPEYRPVLN